MSLLQAHQQAAQALSANPERFGVPVVFTDPAELEITIVAQVADIQAVIDTETQMPVTSRQISVVFGDAAWLAAGGERHPVAIHSGDNGQRPWMVEWDSATWKVFDVRRDRTLGLTTCFLEVFKND